MESHSDPTGARRGSPSHRAPIALAALAAAALVGCSDGATTSPELALDPAAAEAPGNQPTGKPADPGNSADKGKPAEPGSSGEHGKPQDPGSSADHGPPEGKGPPDGTGKPDLPRDPDGLGERMIWEGPFQHPESIVHDPWTHTYLVSNLGELTSEDLGALDGNGFVTEITADGEVVNPRLVESGHYDGDPANPTFDLHSPTGILVVGDAEPRAIVVVDRDAVKAFNRYDGNLVWSTPYPDGVGLANDICAHRDGTLYVTDTGANRLYAFEPGAASMRVVAEGGLLQGPNGCVVRANAVFVANYLAAEGEIIKVVPANRSGGQARMTLVATLGDHLDGLWWFAGRWFATSWDVPLSPESQGAVWRTSTGGAQVTKLPVEPMLTPADAAVDYTLHYPRLLVPSLFGNVILVQPLTNPQTTR